MSFDELDPMMKHYLNPTAYSNMCEILDNIRTKVERFFYCCCIENFVLLNRVELVKLRVIQQEIMDDEHYHRIK